jgi:hypothetical protein
VLWACAISYIAPGGCSGTGYRILPLYRAPGMSPTAYVNLGMILYVSYVLAFRA